MRPFPWWVLFLDADDAHNAINLRKGARACQGFV